MKKREKIEANLFSVNKLFHNFCNGSSRNLINDKEVELPSKHIFKVSDVVGEAVHKIKKFSDLSIDEQVVATIDEVCSYLRKLFNLKNILMYVY